MPRQLQESVVVITGASSGIGRKAAHRFADRGARLVLAARDEAALRDAQRECEERGARAIAVPTDVADEAQVQELARRAVDEFGRVDVWVNNAAVTLFGRFHETPPEDYRRVLETNIFGYVHGARAAMRLFRAQGSGVLVNVSSVVGRAAQPFTSAYTMSKHAIRALSMSLRQELMLDGVEDVHVATVMPATIDTPIFRHAANYTGRAVQAMPPVYPVEDAADAILAAAEHPAREIVVGTAGRLLAVEQRVMPGVAERQMARMVDRSHLRHEPAPPSRGNLFAPMPGTDAVTGGWLDGAARPRRALRGAAVVGGVALAGGLAYYALRRRRRARAMGRGTALPAVAGVCVRSSTAAQATPT